MALDEFLSRVKGVDVARQNRFKVSIKPPPGLKADRNIDLVTETISMPGQNIRSVPDDLRFGPAREQAQGVTYGPFNATFICTTGLPEKVFFEAWQDLVFNKGENEWQVKFYNDYKGEIIISHLDRQDEEKYIMTVHEAYPKTIQEQSYSLGGTDAYQTVTIEFTYRWWSRVAKAVVPFTGYPNQIGITKPPKSPLETGVDYGGLKTVAEREAEGSQWFAGMEQRPDGTWGRKLT